MSDDLVVWLRKRFINEKEWYGVEVDGLTDAADRIEADQELIQEMREALERIAFEGVEDRDKLTRSALDYIATGGMYPNEKTIAAVALSKAKSQQEGETE